jgi:hypothetical protein
MIDRRVLATVFVDIETVPTMRPEIMARIATKHLDEKDPEKTRKKVDEEHRKTSLDGTFGELACVCWAVDDGVIRSSYRALGQSEHEVLRAFTFAMDDLANDVGAPNLLYVAHNADFDRLFLTKRMTVHRLDGPPGLAPRGEKPWDLQWQCTMQTWCDTPQGRISLADLALALSLPVGKDDLPGSEVYDAMLRGEHERVRAHCERDVELVRAVWRRL